MGCALSRTLHGVRGLKHPLEELVEEYVRVALFTECVD